MIRRPETDIRAHSNFALETGSSSGYTSIMAARNRNNPFRTTAGNGHISSQHSTDMAHEHGFQGYPAGSARHFNVDAISSQGGCTSPMNMEHRTYLSSGHVQQWAADNDNGSHLLPDQRSTRNTEINLDMDDSHDMIRSFSVSQYDASHLSLQAANGVYQPMEYSTSLSNAGLYLSTAVDTGSGIPAPFVFRGTSASQYDTATEGAWPLDGEQTHPASVPFDDLYVDAVDMPYSLSSQGGNFDYLNSWPYGSVAPADSFNDAALAPPVHAISMSPLSSATADLSVSSSYSPSSLLAPPSGSPISSITHGDESGLDTNMIADDDCRPSPRFSIGEAMLASIPPDYSNEPDNLSRSVSTAVSPSDSGTVTESFCRITRPSGSSQRPIVPSVGAAASGHQYEEIYMVSPSGDALRRRPSAEMDVTPAREHELYHAVPSDDGLYHCPFEGQENCAHKPTKLKCNYE